MRSWAFGLGALVAVRVAIPLVALAASGHDVPGLPPYDYAPLNGDSFGFYAATREFISSFGRVALPVLALLALGLAVAGAVALRLRRAGRTWHALVLAAGAVSLALVPFIVEMAPSGAAVFGWPLVWSVLLFPLRAAGVLDPDAAFVVGFTLSLLAVAATVVATAYAGLYASGRRSVGLLAAGLFAVWPLLTGPLAGASAWENGQWNVDVGLALYSEPLSTGLVAAAIALLLSPRATELRLALAGLALGLATAVKLSNGVVAALVVALVAYELGLRRALPLAVGGLAFVPVVVAYWPNGYTSFSDDPHAVQGLWSFGNGLLSWTDSLIFEPTVLLVLAPFGVLGAFAIGRRWPLSVLGTVIAATVLFYTFYKFTGDHPRFLYVALPALFVLEAAGIERAGWLAISKVSGVSAKPSL